MNNVLLIIIALFTLFVFNEAGPIWVFSVFILFYIFRNKIKVKLSLLKYILFALITGLFIEALAIINSLKLPIEERALFSPYPIPDLIFAIGYYSFFALGIFFILRKYKFSLKELFIIGGIFGIFAEQHGLVFLSFNSINYLYVFLSYGSFIALPYLIFFRDFKKLKRKQTNLKYLFIILALIVSYLAFLVYYLLLSQII